MVDTLLPSENTVTDRNSAFLAELSEFNAECMLLTQASAIITKTGADLDRLLAAGTENLSRDELSAYLKTLRQFETFIAEYKKRVTAQVAREKALKARAKYLGVAVDFPALSIITGNN